MGNEAELKGIVGSPLDDALGFSFSGIEDGEVVCRLSPTHAALGTIEPPTLHGGALATCVDSACWYAVVEASGSQEWVAVDLGIDYLRPAPPDPLRLTATCLRAGRSLAVAEVRITLSGEPDRLLAVGRATFARSGR
jgi:uncharacterized protein (TIGR00369 family)